MPLIGAVADDLTGATTTGVLLARSKARTAVFFNEEAAEKAEGVDQLDAILISSNSRPLPANEAYDKVTSATLALKRMGVKYFSKRIDTTLRGGVGVEIDAMLDHVDEDAVAVVVPAMPQSRRILVGGYSVIDGGGPYQHPGGTRRAHPGYGELHSQTALRTDPPQDRTCHLKPRLRRPGGHPGRLEGTAAGGMRSDRSGRHHPGRCRRDRQGLHRAEVERGCRRSRPLHFQAGLLPDLIQEESPNVPDDVDESGKTVLIAAGSATPITKKQMEVLCQDPRHVRISVEPIPLVEGGETAMAEVDRAVHMAKELLDSTNPPRAILFETALHGELLNLDEEDNKRHYADGMSANRINAGLGSIIAQVLEYCGQDRIAGLYTTGGDTMVNVCYQLGAQCIELLDYVIPQTDIGRLVGSYDGLPVVGKGGLTETIIRRVILWTGFSGKQPEKIKE